MKTNDTIYIYGKHAVTEAVLAVPRAVKKVFVSETADDPAFREILSRAGVSVGVLGSAETKGVGEDASHQGVVGTVVVSRLVQSYDEFIKKYVVSPDSCFMLLDELNDPHNVGAIIRSAAAFGASAVLIPEHNQAPVTGAVVKVSAGMAFRVPLVSIGNVNMVLRDLKERGFWVFGLDGSAPQKLSDEKFDAPTVLIAGNESKGIRQKTKELCDGLLSIPMRPECESLNVAASTAIALYAWSMKHPPAGK